MLSECKGFSDRIRAGVSPNSTSLVNYITKETFINFKPYSFVGHDFQQYFTELVEKDPDVDITAEKCSQIGLSEVCFRIVLSLMALNTGYSVAYAMPSKSFAQEVLKTRMSPIIDQSKSLSAMISRDVDSASVKMFKNGSILYAIGASANSKSSLINRPIALAMSDELDKLDYDTHTGLRSRQTHSPHKPRIAISTPTAPGVGINAESQNRQVHTQIAICHHCGHEYFPDYFEQVKLPGFNEPIETLTAEKLRTLGLDTDNAFHHCPSCMKISDLRPHNRQWVVEDAHLRKIHVRLTPFDCPSFISPSDLMTSQLTYSSISEFRNQSLGLTSELSDATIDTSKIEFTNEPAPSGIRIAGLDLGKESHYMEAVLTEGIIFVDTIELIPVASLEREVNTLIGMHKVASIVSDSLPFLDTVHKLSNACPMFWPAIYLDPVQPMPELFKLKQAKEVAGDVARQVNINKNLLMDHVSGMLMSGEIVFKHGPFDQLITKHISDMRRVKDYRYQDLRYKWVKSSKGIDHLFHTLCYLVVSSKILEYSRANTSGLPMNSMISTFKNKSGV